MSKHIVTSIKEYLNNNSNIVEYLKDKPFAKSGSKFYLYHGTSVNPNEFSLSDDWDGDSGNVYEADVPEGYLYLTNDIQEAKCYGQYIIPCEFVRNDKLVIKVDSNAPSIEFDDDYSGYGQYGMWTRFMDSTKSILEVKGYNKSTYITDVNNVLPRVDLAIDFYKDK